MVKGFGGVVADVEGGMLLFGRLDDDGLRSGGAKEIGPAGVWAWSWQARVG